MFSITASTHHEMRELREENCSFILQSEAQSHENEFPATIIKFISFNDRVEQHGNGKHLPNSKQQFNRIEKENVFMCVLFDQHKIGANIEILLKTFHEWSQHFFNGQCPTSDAQTTRWIEKRKKKMMPTFCYWIRADSHPVAVHQAHRRQWLRRKIEITLSINNLIQSNATKQKLSDDNQKKEKRNKWNDFMNFTSIPCMFAIEKASSNEWIKLTIEHSMTVNIFGHENEFHSNAIERYDKLLIFLFL